MMKLSRPMWQSAEAGSLPLLFAATSPNARRGGYYGPDGRNEAKGNPTAAFEPVITKDATVGRRLWDESERVTDMQFVISAHSIGIHDHHCVDDARQPVSRAK
jgi:hypothetical protein